MHLADDLSYRFYLCYYDFLRYCRMDVRVCYLIL